MFIGERIRKLRREAELTQTKLAERFSKILGYRIAYQQIQRIEDGTRNVRCHEVNAFAEIFDIDPRVLLEVTGTAYFTEGGDGGMMTLEFSGETPIKIFKENGTLKILYKTDRDSPL